MSPNSSFPEPVAAAHLLMDEAEGTQRFEDIPDRWKNIDFKAVDVLFLSPFFVNGSGHFELGKDKNLKPRLEWLINTARGQHGSIKILAQQFWDHDDLQTLRDDCEPQGSDDGKFNAYAKSVGDMVRAYGLDGYDLDYEWRNGSTNQQGGNVIPEVKVILAKIRGQFNLIRDADTKHRPLYVTISPANSELLDGVAEYVDLVNAQTYSGGRLHTSIDSLLKKGFKDEQLLYGILPEETANCDKFEDAIAAYESNGLKGIHSWRLNSHNLEFETKVQRLVYKIVHSGNPKSYQYSAEEKDLVEKYNANYWDINNMKDRFKRGEPDGIE